MGQGDTRVNDNTESGAIKHAQTQPFEGHHYQQGGGMEHRVSAVEQRAVANVASDHVTVPTSPYQAAPGDVARSSNVKEPVDRTINFDGKSGDQTAAPVEKTLVNPGTAKVEAGEAPRVTVGYSDRPGASQEPATFKVNSQGKVLTSDGSEVKALDFSNGIPKNISIQLERDPNLASLPAEDRKAIETKQLQGLNDFVGNQLDPALRQAGLEVQRSGLGVEDPQKLISERRRAQMERGDVPPEPAPVQPAPHGYSRQERAATHHINGRHGMPNHSRGTMTREHADKFYPNREVPQQPRESNDVYARKEAMAAAFNPDKAHTYETIRKHNDGSYAVGRYGHSFNHFNNSMHHVLHKVHWPASVMKELGDPPDWSKLSKILKEQPDLLKDPKIMKEIQEGKEAALKDGTLPKGMEGRFKDAQSIESYANFVNKLKGKDGELTKEEVAQNVPKEAQEQMAQNTVERGIKSGATAAETVLAQHLGKAPDQLSSQEKTDPANKDYLDAASKFYALAQARNEPGPKSARDPNDPIEWSTKENGMVLAKAALDMSRHIGTVGDCARGPRQTLDQFGFHLKPMIATEQGKVIQASGLFREVSRAEARPGDYFVRDWNQRVIAQHGGVNKGDSGFIYAKNGNSLMAANDHNQVFPEDGGRYRNTKFLRPTAEFWARYGKG